MRITVYQRIQISFFCLLILLLIENSLSTLMTSAQDQPILIIEIYDSNDWNKTIDNNTLFEGKAYDIIVSSENETVVLDVNISLLGNTYTTNLDKPFITILAPHFNDSRSFTITATKEKYLPAETELTVMKGKLSIVADRSIIEEKKEFQVTVTDQDNKPVKEASVCITYEGNPVMTNQQGIAYIQAPDVKMSTTATIQVNKMGYLTGLTNIRIENVEGFPLNLSESQFFQILPIIIAILVVFFAVIYVVWCQKKTPIISNQKTQVGPSDSPSKFQQEKQSQQFGYESTIFSHKEKQNMKNSAQSSKVEEIRVPIQIKKKETTFLHSEKELQHVSNNIKKDQLVWFKGQDYMRYKIDELTGKIDQETDGKWFEGENNSRNKIDETLKKSFKKKKTDKEDSK